MKYAAYYCEENIWHLCAERRDAGLASTVLLLTNAERTCALYNQRAAAPGAPILWDYHVILLANDDHRGHWMVWDLDTRLDLPLGFSDYVAGTFAEPGRLDARFDVRFRVIDGAAWLADFSSDRAHMKTAQDRYRAPPPPWPAITAPDRPGFLSWLDEGAPGPGTWMALDGLIAAFGGTV